MSHAQGNANFQSIGQLEDFRYALQVWLIQLGSYHDWEHPRVIFEADEPREEDLDIVWN